MDPYTEPDLNSAALITIDTQCDTLDGQPLEIPGTSAALPNMRRLLEAFRGLSKPIIHIVRIYQRNGANADLCRKAAIEGGRPMLLQDTTGCQIASEILPKNIVLNSELLLSGGIQNITSSEVIIYKARWGAFYQTPLESHLKSMKISSLIFTGCNFPNCPRTSIYEASERDYRIVLVTDAISGLYEKGESEMKNIGVKLLRTDELLNGISQSLQ
jgi:nicotinamidase-related amidase